MLGVGRDSHGPMGNLENGTDNVCAIAPLPLPAQVEYDHWFTLEADPRRSSCRGRQGRRDEYKTGPFLGPFEKV